jgi:hypothetical protein
MNLFRIAHIVLFILLLNSDSGYSQRTFCFISNVFNENDIPNSFVPFIMAEELISLGDTEDSFFSKNITKKFSPLGDRDVNKIYNSGRFNLEDISKKRACPGPEVKELDNKHVLISFNSNWLINHDYQSEAANEDCQYFNHIHMLEAFEETLIEYNDWNKIIITHHPIESISELNGKGLAWYNLIPFYGQLYNAFKTNIGSKEALPREDYQHYIEMVNRTLKKFDKICFISGHDHINSVLQKNNITFINVNSGKKKYKYKKDKNTVFVSQDQNILSIQLNNGNSNIKLVSNQSEFIIDNPFITAQSIEDPHLYINNEEKDSIAASIKYKSTGFKNFWMGKGYREEWSKKIKAPVLDIDQYDEGLKPYAEGGGLQTMNIKFESASGRKYSFRLLDKQPEKSLSEAARESVYKSIVVELITTMHPYSPLVADKLLNATDIIHVSPELFILGDHPALQGKFKKYVGKLGTLEEKPQGKTDAYQGFYEADKVMGTYAMLLEIRKSPDHKIDNLAYAKARLMDMYLGDWDRHEDNWKWAMFKKGGNHIYKPIPKDRDHVFSHWTGLIPSIADMVIMNAEDFDYKLGNLRHLNYKARFLDRQLACEIDLNTWLEAAEYLMQNLNDEVIEAAINAMPKEIIIFNGETIKDKLISRRKDLKKIAEEYYKDLNKEVQIPATNKRDFIYINRSDDGCLLVEMFSDKREKKGQPFFRRYFQSEQIKKIYLFGLDGRDYFEINGTVDKSAVVEIIGGEDEDEIVDNSVVSENKKATVVYDSYFEDNINNSIKIKIKRPAHSAHYDPYSFNYNYLAPILTFRNSSGNGFGYGAGISYYIRGFNKDKYRSRIQLKGYFYPQLSAFRIDGSYIHKQAIGWANFFSNFKYSPLYDKFPFFYGIGNNTEFIRSERTILNRIDYDYLESETGLEHVFYEKSNWIYGFKFERHKVYNFEDLEVIDPSLKGYGVESFLGLRSELNLDFTDNSSLPFNGSKFNLEVNYRMNFEGKVTGNIHTKFTQFRTVNLGLKTTFIGSIQYMQSIGDVNFYHLSRLGSQTNFRGYTRNRFIDRYALLYNTEIRVNLGTIKSPLIRFNTGLIALYDGGKVWNSSNEFYEYNWQNSYGGGFYISPVSSDFILSFLLAKSDDDLIYNKIQIGYDF